MYALMLAKDRREVRQVMGGLLKALAVPPAMMLAFAVLLAGVAALNGLSGAEFAWAFIGETAEPVVTVMGAVSLGIYVGAAMFFVLPSFRGWAAVTGVPLARAWGAIVQWIYRAVISLRTVTTTAGAAPVCPFGPEPHQPVDREAVPYSEGRNPQRE